MDATLHFYDAGIRVVCWLFAVLFVVYYSRVNWKATPAGRHLMQFTRMIIVFMTLVLLVIFFGPHSWYVWVARFAFTWAAYLLYRRFKMQRDAQHKLSSKPEVTPTLLRRKEE